MVFWDHGLCSLTICMLGSSWIFCRLLIFSKLTFWFFSRNSIRLSSSLDPDQARHNVWPDLGPNCLQRLSADDTSHHLTRFKKIVHMFGSNKDIQICCTIYMSRIQQKKINKYNKYNFLLGHSIKKCCSSSTALYSRTFGMHQAYENPNNYQNCSKQKNL